MMVHANGYVDAGYYGVRRGDVLDGATTGLRGITSDLLIIGARRGYVYAWGVLWCSEEEVASVGYDGVRRGYS